MGVVDIAVAGTVCCFVAMAGAVEAHSLPFRPVGPYTAVA